MKVWKQVKMTIGKLKELIADKDDDLEVRIEVETPEGLVCPDGATMGVRTIYHGFDWHSRFAVIVPEYRLKVKNVPKWTSREPED